jgi:hypothetical protein
MLKYSHASTTPEPPDISELFERLSREGRGWAEAEVRLARAELGAFKGQAIRIVICGVLAFALTFCALFVLSQAAVAFLAPYVDSVGVASLIVGFALIVLVAISLFLMRSALSFRADSVFLRWFATHSGWNGEGR